MPIFLGNSIGVAAVVTRHGRPAEWLPGPRNINSASQAANNFKTAMHQGTFADLNLFVTMLQDGVLGCVQRPPSQPRMPAGPLAQEQPRNVPKTCRATTFPYYHEGSLDGVLIHPYTFPSGVYSNFGLVRPLNVP